MQHLTSSIKSFKHGMRVYWEDTDAGGVVFYANYLKFFERARTEWLRNLGFGQERMRLQDGAMFVVSEAQLKYQSPARLDDWLEVSVQITDIGRASLSLWQQACCGERPLCEAQIRIGCVDSLSFRPCRIPPSIYDKISP